MNIIFLLPDQLRPDFLGCYGARFMSTPNIDALSNEGVTYRRAVSPSPLCVPARASLLTGMNSLQHGVLENTSWLRPDRAACGIETWPEMLAAAGYHTEAIGKMHFYPWDKSEGFAHRVISEDKRHIHIHDDYAAYLEQHGLRKYHGSEHDGYFENKGAIISKIPVEHQVDKWVADRTGEFLENYTGDQPFALMVGFPGPHCPYDPPLEFAELYRPEDMPASIPATDDSRLFRELVINMTKRPWNQVDYTDFQESHKRKIRAHYAALVQQIDQGIGRIVAALNASRFRDDTVIIFASDHGDFLGDFDLIGKHLFFEPSVRVPLIVKLPGSTSARSVESLVSLTDVTATIVALAGVDRMPRSAGSGWGDSIVLPELGLSQTRSRDHVFGATEFGLMVIAHEWKLCRYKNGHVALYNLSDDPHEQRNLAYQSRALNEMQRLDAIMQRDLIDSLMMSNSDKFVEKSRYQGRGEFGQRGWQRPYPASLKERS
jgi:arylsulfatase A-like enzyme